MDRWMDGWMMQTSKMQSDIILYVRSEAISYTAFSLI